jgi:hypothetical protein
LLERAGTKDGAGRGKVLLTNSGDGTHRFVANKPFLSEVV